MKQINKLVDKLFRQRVGLFSQRDTLDEAMKYGLSLVQDKDRASVATALGVYHNTAFKIAADMAEQAIELDSQVPAHVPFRIVKSDNTTKGELAKELYPNMTYDCAIPQSFIKRLEDRGFESPASNFITVYIKHHAETGTDTDLIGRTTMMDGVVMPITDEGIYMLAVLAQFS